MAEPTVKIVVSLPPGIYAQLEHLAKERKLSPWMVQAAREKLETET